MATSRPPVPDLEAAWSRFGDQLRRWLERRVRQPADAEDVLQQVFLKMAASPPLDVPDEKIGAWLFRVARNALVDAGRKARVRRADALVAIETEAREDPTSRKGLTRCLEPMLKTLPETYAIAVRETDLHGRSQRELAAELGLSYSALKSRVQRGRRMLRDNLVACCRPDEDLNCSGCDEDAPCAP